MKTSSIAGCRPRPRSIGGSVARRWPKDSTQDALEEIRNRQGVLSQRASELEIARQQLQDTVLRRRSTVPSASGRSPSASTAQPARRCMTIVRTHPLRLQARVPERETPRCSPARRCVSASKATPHHDGRLERIGAAVDEANRTLPIEAVVPNPNDSLRPGQFATAEIIVSQRDAALVVPRDASSLRRRAEGAHRSRTAGRRAAHPHRPPRRRAHRSPRRAAATATSSSAIQAILVDGARVQVVRGRMKTLAALCIARPCSRRC
jgi:hypothetical protein